jgi:hypothetical protein
MTRKRTPRPGGTGYGAAGVQLRELYSDSSTPPPAVHPALCRECGISWPRPESRPWADLCPTCWRWNMARRHVKAAKALVEGGR